jgi:hypothetical protein
MLAASQPRAGRAEQAGSTEDFKEGVKAAAERRVANFKGR